ncbi:MAG TPA: nucleotide exchange factor GrpE [Phycisphaerae bacterium]|nr:nucleotide exchange factor GrpE [Phycisphaerae bacterium]HRY68784.1 nucleotide exchange factor GrpE [Phycisphaerae bacterium]HSA28893.1 nucleotide exchange factor GrpE [Phycisphaerae bacterium]
MGKKDSKIVIPSEDELKAYGGKPDAGSQAAPADTAPEPAAAGAVAADTATQPPAGEEELAQAGPQSEIEQWKDKYLRSKAELANYQRRSEKDRVEALRYANAGFAKSLLPTIDNLERVLEAGLSHKDNVDAIIDGVRMTLQDLLKALAEHQVERIEAEGLPFDPMVHEAMVQQSSADCPDKTVLKELAKGYRLLERVLRPAKVIVSKAPE